MGASPGVEPAIWANHHENLSLRSKSNIRKNLGGCCERWPTAGASLSGQSPLRILALLEATSITGTAKAVLEMAYEARADVGNGRKVEVTVANFTRGEASADNTLTRSLSAASIPWSFIREASRFDTSVMPQIRDLVKRSQAEVIWTNSVKSHFLVYRSGVQKTCKWVAFHHGYTFTDLKMRLYNQLDRFSLRHADRVVTVCRPFAHQLRRRGVRRQSIRVQHMPIRPFGTLPAEAMKLREEFSLSADAKVVLSVGRLSQEKGHQDLMSAFALLRKQVQDERLRLVLVGDGPERKRLEQQAHNENLDQHVTFAGHRDDAKSFYGIATVFVLPSYTEGTPNVLLEAMVAGVPVISTNVGGVPELVVSERSALLTPPRTPAALAEALQRVLQTPALQNSLALKAAEVVAAHTPRAYFDSMREIFLEAAQDAWD